jgi:NhaA family Na+:H+ antiporter
VLHGVPVGIAAGLFIGKQVGIFGCCWAFVKAKGMELPKGMTWTGLYGTSVLCGIGFTMSLFISALAFEHDGNQALFDERLGILIGSLASGILGYFIIKHDIKRQKAPADETAVSNNPANSH